MLLRGIHDIKSQEIDLFPSEKYSKIPYNVCDAILLKVSSEAGKLWSY